MSEPVPFKKALETFIRAAAGAIRQDPELRGAVKDLMDALRETASEGERSSSVPQAPAVLAQGSPAHAEPIHAEEAGSHEAARPVYVPRVITGPRVAQRLRIGDSNPVEAVVQGGAVVGVRAPAAEYAETRWVPPEPRPAEPRPPDTLPDLEIAEKSTTLKEEAARILTRTATAEDATRLAAIRGELSRLGRANARDEGDLWMFDSTRPPERLRLAPDAYRALHLAATLGATLRKLEQLRPDNGLERAFALMAQAQSGIRRLVNDATGETDSDQFAVFRWLRTLTAEDQCRVMIDRYMRRDDIADPAEAPALGELLKAELDEWTRRVEADRKTRKLMQKIGHKAKLLSHHEAEDPPAIWQQLDQHVAEAVEAGMRTSDPKLRQALALIAGTEPEAFHPGEAMGAALREARRQVERRRDEREEEPDSGTKLAIAAEAAALLAELGVRRVAIVGGVDYPEQAQRLKRDFGLDEVIRVTAPEEKSNADLGARVRAAHPDLVLVTRWLSHPETDHVLRACEAMNMRAIRLPYSSGLGTGAVADAILQQLTRRSEG